MMRATEYVSAWTADSALTVNNKHLLNVFRDKKKLGILFDGGIQRVKLLQN